jgi:hypothetical protein
MSGELEGNDCLGVAWLIVVVSNLAKLNGELEGSKGDD